MSIFKVCTQLRVLHLSGPKIYESHRQRSPALSLSLSPLLSPVTCPLTLSIFSFPIISSGVSQTQLVERDRSATISLCSPLIKRVRACLAKVCVIAPQWAIEESTECGWIGGKWLWGKQKQKGWEERAKVEFFRNARGFSSGRVCIRCLFTRGALRASGKITMSNKPGYSEMRPHPDGVLHERIISNKKCALVLFVLKF